jgi:tRNA(Ile)-lysidine synthase
MTSSIKSVVVDFFRKYLSHEPFNLCVAVSGGADSVAMFHLIFSLKEELCIKRLGIVHVNHSLRGKESDGDADFVREIAGKYGVDFFSKSLVPPSIEAKGIEAWARKERYEFFGRIMEKEGFRFVATGHTADDQAETVLMRIMRGCGLKGLCGISPVREDGIIRPLLFIKREVLRSWLAGRGKTFREDSSNSNITFFRNSVRHNILPELEKRMPGSSECLSTVAMEAYNAWLYMQQIINKWVGDYVVFSDFGFSVKKDGFMHEFVAAEGISFLLRNADVDFRSYQVDAVLENNKRNYGTFLLPSGWKYVCRKYVIDFINDKRCQCSCDLRNQGNFSIILEFPGVKECTEEQLLFVSEAYTRNFSDAIEFSKDNMTVFIDRSAAGKYMVYRSIRPEDRFRPLGGKYDLNIINYIKKQRIGKKVIGVVEGEKGNILWIPGIQISEYAKISPETKCIIKISCRTANKNVF